MTPQIYNTNLKKISKNTLNWKLCSKNNNIAIVNVVGWFKLAMAALDEYLKYFKYKEKFNSIPFIVTTDEKHKISLKCHLVPISSWKLEGNHEKCYFLLDGKIYAMGGYNGRTRMSSVERYDPDSNQWELVAPMLRQRSDASAAVLDNKVRKHHS